MTQEKPSWFMAFTKKRLGFRALWLVWRSAVRAREKLPHQERLKGSNFEESLR